MGPHYTAQLQLGNLGNDPAYNSIIWDGPDGGGGTCGLTASEASAGSSHIPVYYGAPH